MPNRKQETSTELIDIDKKSSDRLVFSEGSLDQLDKENRIRVHWFKERTIVWLSVVVIFTILLFSVVSVTFSGEETTRDWGRQTLSALLGFAAGAIWQTRKKD